MYAVSCSCVCVCVGGSCSEAHVRFRPLVPFRRVGHLMGNHRVQVDNGAFGLAPRAKCQNGGEPRLANFHFPKTMCYSFRNYRESITTGIYKYFIIFLGNSRRLRKRGGTPPSGSKRTGASPVGGLRRCFQALGDCRWGFG